MAGKSPWNTGFTKLTHKSLALAAEKKSKTIRRKIKNGEIDTKIFSRITKRRWKDGIYDNKVRNTDLTDVARKAKKRWRDGVYDDSIKSMTSFRRIRYMHYMMRSSWEIKFAKWLRKKNIKFLYEPKIFRLSNGKRYMPDFFLPATNEWIEIKGRLELKTIKKLDRFRKEYPKEKFTVLRYGDLKNAGIL